MVVSVVTESVESGVVPENGQPQLSLGTAAARNLATTTKTRPQMQGITSRWLLRMLPWVQVKGGTYRVNRRLTYTVGDGRVTFTNTGADVRVVPPELAELAPLHGFDDIETLTALADRFTQREFAPGEALAEAGGPIDRVVLIAHGKVSKIGTGEYGDETILGTLADGDHFGAEALVGDAGDFAYGVRADTPVIALVLSRRDFDEIASRAPGLAEHVASVAAGAGQASNEFGEAAIELASGHEGEPVLPGTFVDYELSPREYSLSVAQTVLRVHTRVADLYNEPMNQIEQQLRLTIEALRERQEHELINNREFGLLHNADLKQRVHTRGGPPTPDDMDELLATVWKNPGFFLAHPRAIAAFGRECSRRGVYPQSIELGESRVPAWRGVPIFPCNKLPISDTRTTSIMLMRTGEHDQGVVGLHQVGLPDEYQPGLSVRFMGINDQALICYLVSAYYSASILVPDALGVLENVEIAHFAD
jgi:CRP-like cAMP-binding protein